MSKPLRALIVEDSEDDTLLLVHELQRGGYAPIFERVETAEAMTAALKKQVWDIIFSDYEMPHFNVPEALRLLQQSGLDLPFIVISGIIGEDTAVATMKAGAHDYLMKSNLKRLAPAIERELNEAEVRRQRRQAEEDLLKAEQNFRNSLDSSPLGIRIITEEGELLYANRAILDIYGYSSIEKLKTVPVIERYTPESYLKYQEREEARKLGKPTSPDYEISIVRWDGEIRHLAVFRKEVLWNGQKQFQVLYLDITERKKMEETLKESEEKFSQVFYSNPSPMVIQLKDSTRICDINAAFTDLVGQTYEECIGKTVDELDIWVSKQDKERLVKMRREQGSLANFEMDMRSKTGEIRDVLISSEIIILAGEPYHITAIRDITEHKQAEEKIRQVAEEWESTFNSITDSVSIHDKDFKIVRVNSAFAETVKMEPKELVGKTCYEVVHGTTEPVANCPHAQTLKDKKPHRGELFEPHLGIHLEMSTSPVFNEKGEIVAIVHITKDITERRKMEEQLILADRLASIGELSSGVAHELNNPLTSIIGFSDLLLDTDVPDDIKEDLKVINREAHRTAGVVRNLLTFARKHPPAKEPVDINGILRDILELRAYEQKVGNIEVNTRFASSLPKITADAFQLQQVFVNIIINAEHFMNEAHGRGTLTITTQRVGDVIRLSFADDGPGIAEENLRNLFDPFFTTKEVGKGTGLGLSICHGIISEHGGQIYVKNKSGKGATFVVEIPILKSVIEGQLNGKS